MPLPSPASPPTGPTLAPPAAEPGWDDRCYLALRARDARFDGRFFTGVTSTGVYCRPVCGVRTPRRENCRFYPTAAHAEQAGFRPCLRCRPELAPADLHWSATDAAAVLVREALRRLDPAALGGRDGAWAGGDGGAALPSLAAQLGVSDRHLRRVFRETLGLSPHAVWQTRRLLAAKQLLTDTPLPMAEVAAASGFGSVRRLQAAFATHYGLQPSALRRPAAAGSGPKTGAPVPGVGPIRLGYRPPFDTAALLGFWAQRQLAGLEEVAPEWGRVRRTVPAAGGRPAGWVEAVFVPDRPEVHVRLSDELLPDLPARLQQVRDWLDLDADPAAIHGVLGSDFPAGAGLRVPGTLDGFELAVRAILGQQVRVAVARTLAQRVLDTWGTPVTTPWPGLARAFPTPHALAQALPEQLGALGIVRQRQQALLALARSVCEGRLDLSATADVATTVQVLRSLPGIGDWTAEYIALRALRWPDAFPSGDVALQQALGLRDGPSPPRATQARAEAWRPWRGYAVVRAWAGCYQPGAADQASAERQDSALPAVGNLPDAIISIAARAC